MLFFFLVTSTSKQILLTCLGLNLCTDHFRTDLPIVTLRTVLLSLILIKHQPQSTEFQSFCYLFLIIMVINFKVPILVFQTFPSILLRIFFSTTPNLSKFSFFYFIIHENIFLNIIFLVFSELLLL